MHALRYVWITVHLKGNGKTSFESVNIVKPALYDLYLNVACARFVSNNE